MCNLHLYHTYANYDYTIVPYYNNIGRLTERDLYHLTKILRPAAPKWKEIGGKLKIETSELDIIAHQPTLIVEGVPGYFREMLSRWLSWAPPNHSWPTIHNLIHAVRKSGFEDLAVKLQGEYSINTQLNSLQ